MPVTVHFSGDESQLTAVMNKIIAQQERMERGFQKTSHAAAPLEGHLMGQVKAIAAMGAGLLTVNTLMSSIIGKVKEKEALEAKAAGRALAQVNPQRAFLDALGAPNAVAQEASIKRLQDLAARTKIPMGEVYTEAALGLRLTGRDEARTSKLMELAAQMEPGSAEDREAMLESGIAIMKFKGVKDEKEAMALADLIGDSMGVVEPKKMVKQLTQAMARVKGATAVEVGGLVAALSQASGDKTGKGLAEAVEKIGGSMEEQLPAQTRRDPKTGKVIRGIGVEGFGNQMEWLRNAPPAQRERFFAEAGIEGKFGQGFRDLVTGAPGVATESYQKFMAEAPGAAAGWDKQAALLNRPFSQKIGAADRGLTAMQEGLANTPVGRGAAIAGLFSFPKLKETLGISGQFGVESILTDLQQKAQWYSQPGQNPEEFIKLLKQRAYSMQGVGWVQRQMALSGQPFPGVPESGQESMRQRVLARPMSQQERDLGATSEVLLKMIPELTTLFKDLLEENKRTNTLLEKAQATPSAAAVQENRNQHGPGPAYGFWQTFGFGTPAR